MQNTEAQSSDNLALINSPLLKQLRGEPASRIPCWFMRQAGRYLPEYRALRAKHAMLDLIRDPQLAREVTLQPLRRFDLDAAIIFADILTPLCGMGINLDFVDGEGPKIFNPVRSFADVEKLKVPAPGDNVAYTLDAIKLVSDELTPRGVPLLGFCGAPFTLACYLLQEEDSMTATRVKRFALETPSAWGLLQDKLVELCADYLVAQVEAGASAVQLFDSWVGAVSPDFFARNVLPALKAIVKSYRARARAPILFFGLNTTALLPQIATIGFDGVSIDWRCELRLANQLLGGRTTLQGNIDPALLTLETPLESSQVFSILDQGRKLRGHIMNVGHGFRPDTKIERITELLKIVREYRGERDVTQA